MSVLDQIIDLKNRGVSESEIIENLKQQGFSPRVITEAMDRAKIKSAVSAEGSNNIDENVFEEGELPKENEGDMEVATMLPERAEPLPTEGEISDIDLTPPSPTSQNLLTLPQKFPLHYEISEKEYEPKSEPIQKTSASQDFYQPFPYGTEQVEYSQQPDQQAYGASPEYGYGIGYEQGYNSQMPFLGTDTMIEIAEQVFMEKTKSIQKQIESLNEFKILMQSKIENIAERLKRIEYSIDGLQAEILEKVGSYGTGLDLIKKEMSMMQDSFTKTFAMITKGIENKPLSTMKKVQDYESSPRESEPASKNRTNSQIRPHKKRSTVSKKNKS